MYVCSVVSHSLWPCGLWPARDKENQKNKWTTVGGGLSQIYDKMDFGLGSTVNSNLSTEITKAKQTKKSGNIQENHLLIVIAVLFLIVNPNPKCLLLGDQINKQWHIHTM